MNGNITGIAESVSQTTLAYTYDDLNRLTGESNGTDAYVYAYDAGGNLTSVKKNGATVGSYAYGNTNWRDQLTSFNGKGITYDANGNPLSYDGKTFTWQRATQLSGITSSGNSISYVYDSQGHRVQKTVNGAVTSYLYSGDLLVRQTIGVNTLDFRYDSNGNAIGFIYNGADYYYVRNLQGDVVSVVDADGAVVASYTYDAWGNILSATGTMAAINPLRYRGYYYDAESGYYYLNSRYYSPEWRRFINADVLFIAGDAVTGSNMYAYCNDNPVMYVDTEGTKAHNFIQRWIDSRLSEYSTDISFAYNAVSNLSSQYISGKIGKYIITPGANWFMEDVSPKISRAMDFLYSGTEWENRKYPFRDIPLLQIRTHSPKNLSMFAGIGAMVLDFHKNVDWNSPNCGNYTTLPGSYQWQKLVGYNWWYDWFFSLGGPNEAVKYPFVSNNTYYVVWCWKADYWNLGAGAEIGIYYQTDPVLANKGYYDIDTENLNVHVCMNVKYDDMTITTDFVQTNWWITSFTPSVQSADVNLIDVEIKTAFVNSTQHGNLLTAFANEAANQTGVQQWETPDLVFFPSGMSQSDPNYGYQFQIKY